MTRGIRLVQRRPQSGDLLGSQRSVRQRLSFVRWHPFCHLMLLALPLVAGCGSDRPPLVTVSGRVTLDGQPLADAQVAMRLITDEEDSGYGRPSRAFTDAQGVFRPVAYGDAAGIPAGRYKVAVVKQEIPENYNAEDPAATPVNIRWVTPRYYSDIDTSGLEVEVTADGIVPDTLALQSNGPGEIENTGGQRGANDP